MVRDAATGALLARAAFEWLLGLDGPWVAAAVLAAAVAGGVIGLGEARGLRPMAGPERRDAIVGWGALAGAVIAIACLYLPFPWGVVAALAALAVTALVLRRVPLAPPDGGAVATARG